MYVFASLTNPIISGSSLTLTCTVEFHQRVDTSLTVGISWTRPNGSAIAGATLTEMETLTLYRSSIITEALTDSGNYTCTVNAGGATEVSASTNIVLGINTHNIIEDNIYYYGC